MSVAAREIEIIKMYLETPVDAMCALDDERRRAEQDCADARIWLDLADRYNQQGRPAQAASCRRRGEHYGELLALQPVSAETAEG